LRFLDLSTKIAKQTVAIRAELFTDLEEIQMEEEKLPNENAGQNDEEKLHRREMAGRMGKFLAYTAPALIALSSAKAITY
jgi:hypothetical protein